MAHKDIYVLISRICKYITLQGKGGFAVFLRTLRWEELTGLSRCAQCSHSGLDSGRQRQVRRFTGKCHCGRVVGEMQCIAGFEDGERGPQTEEQG